MGNPTLRDIADRLGVSTATVSLAMRGDTRIGRSTRRRVEAAVAEVGYVYQRSAASLRTARTHTVGVILNDITDPFFSALLASLERELAAAGRTTFLRHSGESPEHQGRFMRTMSEYNADGLIMCPAIGTTFDDISPREAGAPPVVFVSRTVPDTAFDSVVNDDEKAGRLAAERLLSLGHRRIALVGGHPSVSCYGERLRGYRTALERASVPFDEALVRPLVPSRLEGFRAAGWLAALEPRPTAASCYNGSVALGLTQGLAREGLVPGRNFALIGHEDVEEASLAYPPMSVTTVAREEMGRQAAAALAERIENPELPPRRIVLDTRLVVRETCGVPPSAATEP